MSAPNWLRLAAVVLLGLAIMALASSVVVFFFCNPENATLWALAGLLNSLVAQWLLSIAKSLETP